MDTRTHPVNQRIAMLREAMAAAKVSAVFIPSSDPHLSEYLPDHWKSREWFSGFTGSMGSLAITATEAALFADSRYWVQAEKELAGTGVKLVKIATGVSTEYIDWFKAHLTRGQALAADAQVLSLGLLQLLQSELASTGIVLQTALDLPGAAWPDRAALPSAALYEHLLAFAGESRAEKLAFVRTAMAQAGASQHVISTVDDLAWLTNLRGSDVQYNPVFLAHALISANTATLFVGAGKVSTALQAALSQDGWQLADYAAFSSTLNALPASAQVLLDPKRVTAGTRQALPAGAGVIQQTNPSTHAKARKGSTQAAHIREAMRQDGAAMCAFYAWFEAAMARGERITEITVDEKLSAERAKRPGFVGLSFSTIAGFNANGALPHYRAYPDAHAVIEGNGLLLIDSGGQYLGGTTDITRVWPIGQTSAAQKRDYTLVLKGTMQLSRAKFPRGTPSPMLDTLAREPMWQYGLDFGHGTGHGVGYFLNVHEGPQSISRAIPTPDHAMQPGMITSVEPGLYREGQWGIRIENLVLNVLAQVVDTSFGEFLEFETLTLCPIDTRLIDRSLMRADETAWLNAYHATVRERLLPLVDGNAKAWLIERTEAI
jgi:Xaa-Pro aminopeptidase